MTAMIALPELSTCLAKALRLAENLPECLLIPPTEAVETAAHYGQNMPVLIAERRYHGGWS